MTELESPSSFRRWPAEWEPHEASLLAWPSRSSTWPGCFPKIPHSFTRLVETIADFQPVFLLANPGDGVIEATRFCGTIPQVTIVPIATNDVWIRDYGPIGVLDRGTPLLLDFRFNSWGGKYPPWNQDDEATAALARWSQLPNERSSLVLEGGAIEGNGDGLLLATRSSVIDERRNPGISESQIEETLRQSLGAHTVVFLEHGGLIGDDTDGHIDQLARFINCNTLVVSATNDHTDANADPLTLMQAELIERSSDLGMGLQVIPLPVPQDVTFDGHRLPASYCNFTFVQDAVIIPSFQHRFDDHAEQILGDLLPDKTIVSVDCRELAWGLGAVHCLTQSLPKAQEPTRALGQ